MAISTKNPPIPQETIEKHGIKQQEYQNIIKLLGRHPNINELGMFSVMWSEHCCYKSSKKLLKTLPTEAEHVVCGPGENAGIIDIGDDIYITFKIESHNHPTAVEPYQGAATGVGGILRDIFTMGARPIALLNSLRFGNLNNPKNRYLFGKAVAGIAGYGNCMGIPTVGGECCFDDCFSGNPLVNAMAVGVIYDKNIITSGAQGTGNPVIYVGSATGRDGMGGAAFASKEITDDSEKDRPAVQVGDPFTEKLLMEACLEAFQTDAVIAAQDMGAAGLTCSVSEMASKGNMGINLDLDKVPARADNMIPYEYLLSESQERMLFVVDKDKVGTIQKIFDKWELPAVQVGTVTDSDKIVITFKKDIVVDLDPKSLTDNAPEYAHPSAEPDYIKECQAFKLDSVEDISLNQLESTLLKILNSPNIASKAWVFNQYDRQVQNNSITESADNAAALVRIRDKHGKLTNKGLAISVDCNSRFTYLDPYNGAALAVLEAARNVACTGAKPLAITNNLNFANPEKPEMFWQLEQAAKGMADACKALNTPVTGGNVSLYNETNATPIYPTPVIGMVGLIENVNNSLKTGFTTPEDIIILVGETKEELGGSEYLATLHNIVKGKIPSYSFSHEQKLHQFCETAAEMKLLSSCNDLSEGGLLVALAESCITNSLGAKLVSNTAKLTTRLDASLFGESTGRLLLSLSAQNLDKTKGLLEKLDLPYNIIGRVQPDLLEIENSILKIRIDEVKKVWTSALPRLMAV